MLIAFLLVLIYPDRSLVLPHQYKTREECHAAAYGRREDAERFACIQIRIDLEDK